MYLECRVVEVAAAVLALQCWEPALPPPARTAPGAETWPAATCATAHRCTRDGTATPVSFKQIQPLNQKYINPHAAIFPYFVDLARLCRVSLLPDSGKIKRRRIYFRNAVFAW